MLIVCPFDLEAKILFQDYKLQKYQDVPFKAFQVNLHGKTHVVVISGQGKVNCALATMYMLAELKPDKAFLIGSGGVLKKEGLQQDLFLGKTSIEYDFLASTPQRKFDSPRLCSNEFLWRELDEKLSAGGLKVECVSILSGDRDVWDVKERNALANGFDSPIVAWEGAGFLKACRAMGANGIEIRVPVDSEPIKDLKYFKKHLDLQFQKISNPLVTAISEL